MSRIKRSAFTAATFGATAPLIASCAYAVLAMIVSMIGGGMGAEILLGVFWLLPFAYVLAGLPAALSGAALGALLDPRSGWPFILAAAGAGALVAFGIGFFDAERPEVTEGVLNMALIGAVSGFGSGVTSSRLSRRRKKPDASNAS